jgi:hypothetical protein
LQTTIDEYDAAAKLYPLPAGQSYPPPSFGKDDGVFESGYGASEAVHVWNCAWGKRYLATEGSDPAAASDALAQFASITKTDTFKRYYDPQSVQIDYVKAIDNARLGDPSGVQQMMDANCTG